MGVKMFTISTVELILLIAATWRLSSLLANEEGPFHVFSKLRRRIGVLEARSRRKGGVLAQVHLYEGVQCEWCNSIWFGILLTVVYGLFHQGAITDLGWFVLPLALSAGAILVKHIIQTLGSIDTRFDQQNQAHVKEQEELKKLQAQLQKQFRGNGFAAAIRASDLDQHNVILERREQ